MTTRRGFLASMLAACAAPAAISSGIARGIIMPPKIIAPPQEIIAPPAFEPIDRTGFVPLDEYIAFVHPDMERDLRELAFPGYVGRYEGVRIITTPELALGRPVSRVPPRAPVALREAIAKLRGRLP